MNTKLIDAVTKMSGFKECYVATAGAIKDKKFKNMDNSTKQLVLSVLKRLENKIEKVERDANR